VSVLVTGAAGFAGGHLLDLLTNDGIDVFAWYRPSSDAPPRRQHVTWQPVDIVDGDAVNKAIAAIKPRAVYHCAGAAHVGKAWDNTTSTLETNTRGTHNLLEAVRKARVAAKVLIPSSALIYRSSDDVMTEDHPLGPQGPYALSKLAQEMTALRARADGIHVSIARSFNHTGPQQDPFFAASGFARRIADIEAGKWKPELAVGNLDARRDIHDVRDTVRAYRLILEKAKTAACTTSVRGARSQFGAWSTRCSAKHACPSPSASIRHDIDRTTSRYCWAIRRVFKRSWVGCLKSISTRRSKIC